MIVVSFSQDDTGKAVLIQADTKITQCTADRREKTIASPAENQLCAVHFISGPWPYARSRQLGSRLTTCCYARARRVQEN